MYRGFQIDNKTIKKILDNKNFFIKKYEPNEEKIKEIIKKNLNNYLTPNNKIDVEKLREDWFPTDQYDVFISHSHKDIDDVKALAGYLTVEKKMKVFVDSFIWGYFEKLQRDLDNEYNLQNNNSYNYQGSNWCCNNVSIILNSALQEVIDKSEAVIFYNTPNSITHNYKDKDRTESPWIFSEIETTRIIRKKSPQRMTAGTESTDFSKINNQKSAEFSYWLNKNHLSIINENQFNSWMNHSSKFINFIDLPETNGAKDELDRLYAIVDDK